jgi:hypothetical protein
MCYACGSNTHQTPRSVDCSEHKCATCQGELEPKGHNHKNCPLAQCDACNLSGHIADVCTFRQCYDVEVDYLLNLLLLTKGRNTIESYFDANGEACIQPNALRIHGKFTESIDWDDVKQRFAITDRQVLELKSVAYEFKWTTTQEYHRAQREVNHPSNAPIRFAFPEFQTDPNGTTRRTDYDRDITQCATPLALVILLIKMASSTIRCTHRRVGLPVGHGPRAMSPPTARKHRPDSQAAAITAQPPCGYCTSPGPASL